MSERVIKLFEDRSFLKKERDRARKVTVGIKGFGSFCNRPVSGQESMNDERYLRSNSECQNKENQIMDSETMFICKQRMANVLIIHKNVSSVIEDPISDAMEWNQHPFCDIRDNHSRASLLSTSG